MMHFLLAGGTGVGKSSTINALKHRTSAKVGYGSEPQTQTLMGYGADGYVLWDSPGLGEGVKQDQLHVDKIKQLIFRNHSHCIRHLLLIIEANKRDFGTVYKVIDSLVRPKFEKNVTVLMNQADQAMKGQNWSAEANAPKPALADFLRDQALSIQERIKSNTGLSIPLPIVYSAYTGYGVPELHEYLKALSCSYRSSI